MSSIAGQRRRGAVSRMPSANPCASHMQETLAETVSSLKTTASTKYPSASSSTSGSMPPALRSLLLELFGTGINSVMVIEYSWINALHGWPLAVTRRDRIYLRHDIAHFHARPELVLHEYFHVLHQWNTGRLTLWRYVLCCLRHGYWNNPFEVEARAFAAQHIAALQPVKQPPVRRINIR